MSTAQHQFHAELAVVIHLLVSDCPICMLIDEFQTQKMRLGLFFYPRHNKSAQSHSPGFFLVGLRFINCWSYHFHLTGQARLYPLLKT
jgi:hypothetical protein